MGRCVAQTARSRIGKGYATTELLDQHRQQMGGAQAALNAANAANARIGVAEHALDAARHDVELTAAPASP